MNMEKPSEFDDCLYMNAVRKLFADFYYQAVVGGFFRANMHDFIRYANKHVQDNSFDLCYDAYGRILRNENGYMAAGTSTIMLQTEFFKSYNKLRERMKILLDTIAGCHAAGMTKNGIDLRRIQSGINSENMLTWFNIRDSIKNDEENEK